MALALTTAMPRSIHVSVGDRRDLRIAGIVVPRPRALTAFDRTQVGVVPVTTAARTVMDIAGRSLPLDLEIALDDALRRGLIRAGALASRINKPRTSGRPGITTLRKLLAERAEDVATESALETRFLRLIKRSALPRPRSQYIVTRQDASFVARVDFAYPEIRLAIELDGYTFHDGRNAFDRDRVRQNALIDAGWTILRFTSTDLADEASLVCTLRRVLARCGLRAGSTARSAAASARERLA